MSAISPVRRLSAVRPGLLAAGYRADTSSKHTLTDGPGVRLGTGSRQGADVAGLERAERSVVELGDRKPTPTVKWLPV